MINCLSEYKISLFIKQFIESKEYNFNLYLSIYNHIYENEPLSSKLYLENNLSELDKLLNENKSVQTKVNVKFETDFVVIQFNIKYIISYNLYHRLNIFGDDSLLFSLLTIYNTFYYYSNDCHDSRIIGLIELICPIFKIEQECISDPFTFYLSKYCSRYFYQIDKYFGGLISFYKYEPTAGGSFIQLFSDINTKFIQRINNLLTKIKNPLSYLLVQYISSDFKIESKFITNEFISDEFKFTFIQNESGASEYKTSYLKRERILEYLNSNSNVKIYQLPYDVIINNKKYTIKDTNQLFIIKNKIKKYIPKSNSSIINKLNRVKSKDDLTQIIQYINKIK